jgi:hypothetical protein
MSFVYVGLSIAGVVLSLAGAVVHVQNIRSHPDQTGRNIYRRALAILCALSAALQIFGWFISQFRVEFVSAASFVLSLAALIFGLAEWRRR